MSEFSGIDKTYVASRNTNEITISIHHRSTAVNDTDTLMTKVVSGFVPNQYPLHTEAIVSKKLGSRGGYDVRKAFTATFTSDGAIDFSALIDTNKLRFERGLVSSVGDVDKIQNKSPGLLIKVPRKHVNLEDAMNQMANGGYYDVFYEKLANLFNNLLAENAASGFCHNNLHACNVLVDLANNGDLLAIDYSLAFVAEPEPANVIATFNNLGQSELYKPMCLPQEAAKRDDVWRGMCQMNPFVKGFLREIPHGSSRSSTGLWTSFTNWFSIAAPLPTVPAKTDDVANITFEIDRFAIWADLAGLIMYLMIRHRSFHKFLKDKFNGGSDRSGRGNRYMPSHFPISIDDKLRITRIDESKAIQILENTRVDSIIDAIAIATLFIAKFKEVVNVTDTALMAVIFDNGRLANRNKDDAINVYRQYGLYNGTESSMLNFLFFNTGVMNPYMYFKCMDHMNLRSKLGAAFKARERNTSNLPISRASSSPYTPTGSPTDQRVKEFVTELLEEYDDGAAWTSTLKKKSEYDPVLQGLNNGDVIAKGMGMSNTDGGLMFVECKDKVEEEKMHVLNALGNNAGPSMLSGGAKRTHIVIKETGKARNARKAHNAQKVQKVRKVRVDPDTGARFVMLEGDRVLLSEMRGRYRYI